MLILSGYSGDLEMLRFKIFEIPDARSEKTVSLDTEAFDLNGIPFKGGSLQIEFYKTLQFIQTKLNIQADVRLICDRSLELFDYHIDINYEVIFKADTEEETADEHGAIRSYDLKLQQIDLEQDVRDTILLEIPIKKLHPRFLDSEGNPIEFETKEYGKPSEEESEEIDPRWEALKELKK